MDRRQFILNALTLSVFSASGMKLLGEIKPVKKMISGELFYTVPLDEFPDLKKIWGSVRMRVKGVSYWDFPEFIVTRVPYDEYEKHFTCVSTLCTHQSGIIYDLDEYREFECSVHGTLFSVEGDYIVGPASDPLDRWNVYYDGGDSFDIDLPDGLLISVENSVDEYYILQNYPNPADTNSMIEIALMNYARVTLDIFDSKGNFIENIVDDNLDSGNHKFRIDTSRYISGLYIYYLMINGKKVDSRKMIVRH